LDAQLMAPRAWMMLVWRTSSSVKLEEAMVDTLWTHKVLQQHVRQTLSVQPVRKALKGVDLVPAMSTAMGRYRVQHAQARLDAQLMAPRA
jgi:hypothetical protein